MEEKMEHLKFVIANLMSNNNETIKKATADMQEACKRPETLGLLCEILVTAPEEHVGQYSAVLIRKLLIDMEWNSISAEEQDFLKKRMMNALLNEEKVNVRKAIGQVIGVILHHESKQSQSYMNDIFMDIGTYCSSPEPRQSEIGASVFSILAEAAPLQFSPHIESVCNMLFQALSAYEATGNMGTAVLHSIMCGMTHLMGITLGHSNAEQTLQNCIPLILKSLQAFAVKQEVDRFVKSFEILESMVDDNPKLLNNHIQILLEFCIETCSSTHLDSAIRNKAIGYIGLLVQAKKKLLIKLKLTDIIINVIFNLMTTEPHVDEDLDDYFIGGDQTSPFVVATKTMDLIALMLPAEKFISPLLALLVPALTTEDPLKRRGAYLTMAVIAEGCSEAICNQYLGDMINVLKTGINDVTPFVRDTAFFALGQFSDYMQPDITKFAPQIMPLFFSFLEQLCTESKASGTEPKNLERMFYAIETFCEHLDGKLTPYLPTLMNLLFKAMDPRYSVNVHVWALRVIAAAASSAEENMMPYAQTLLNVLETYLGETDNTDIKSVQPQAINTLASLAFAIGKNNFLPLATATMNFAVNLSQETDETEIRSSLYKLVGSLAKVANEEIVQVFPQIMQCIFNSIRSPAEAMRESSGAGTPRTTDLGENAKDKDDSNAVNSNSDEKHAAMFALMAFAEHTGAAFLPYLQLAYQDVSKMIGHSYEEIRKTCIDTLCAFAIALHKHKDIEAVSNLSTHLIPLLAENVHHDDDISVVLAALRGISNILKGLKAVALPSETLRDNVFSCIYDVMQGKAACQYFDSVEDDEDDENDESEYEEAVFAEAGDILSLFGAALTPDQFAPYFEHVHPVIVRKLQNAANHGILDDMRASIYHCLAQCFDALKTNCGALFNKFYHIMLSGICDKSDEVRENAVFGLGVLVYYSGESSYQAYPAILTALSPALAQEKRRRALDKFCGAISRLILTNHTLVPLDDMLQKLIYHLPIHRDFTENFYVIKCFESTYLNAPDVVVTSLRAIIINLLHVICKKQYTGIETYELSKNLLKKLYTDHAQIFAEIAAAAPAITENQTL